MNRAQCIQHLAEAASYRVEALQILRNRKLSYDGRHYEFELAVHHARVALYNAIRLH